NVEAVPLDQPTGNMRPCLVKFRGAVCRLAQQDNARFSKALEQRSENWIVRFRQWFCGASNELNNRWCADRNGGPFRPKFLKCRRCINCRFSPTRFANERHKSDRPKILFVEPILAVADDLHQFLGALALANRYYQ